MTNNSASYSTMGVRARIRRVLIVCAVVAFATLVWDFSKHLSPGWVDAGGEQLGRDFVICWSGAHLAAAGDAVHAYHLDDFIAYEKSFFGSAAEPKIYAYPPTTLLLTLPFGEMPYVPAFALAMLAGIALCALLLARMLGWRMAFAALFGAPAAFINLFSGQNGQYSAVLLAAGLCFLDRRPVFAGICLGGLCFKPQMGLLLPFALVAGGRWRTIISAAVTVLLLTLASWLAFGSETWAAFLDQTQFQSLTLTLGDSFWPRMPTIFAALRILGVGAAASYGVQVLSAIGAAVLVAWIWRQNCATEIKNAALVTAIFVASPYAWDYDMVILIFAAAWLLSQHSFEPTGFELSVAIAVLTLPLTEVFFAKVIGVPTAPPILWVALWLLFQRSRAVTMRVATPTFHAA